jgi:polar amino acid transport system substrate-binding protein
MLSRRFLMGLAGLACWPVQAQTALEWVAGDLPPFGWRIGDVPQGFAQDLVVAMGQRLGRQTKVSYFPWARAVRMAETGSHYGIFPLSRTPEREAKFRWLVPLLTVNFAFVTLATDKLLAVEQLRGMRVGVLRGSPVIKNLQAERFESVIEAKDYRDLLRLLNDKTIAAIFAGAPMLNAAMDEYGFARKRFTSHAVLAESTLYLAASKRLDAAEAERWVKAYEALEADGTVARLKKRYLP